MNQNTEQNVRTLRERDGQVQEMHADMVKAVCGRRSDYPEDVFRAYLKRHIVEAEARGAEEQRRKDAEGCEIVRQYLTSRNQWEDCSQDRIWAMAVESDATRRILYTRPPNIAALEARVKELEAREERDGWQYLTENTSSDSGLPSCRLNFMFQEGDSRERIEETASAFGIEVCWDVTDWDWQGPPEEMEELSADDLAKCAPRTDLTDAGWKLVDVWDTEDGEIVRMYARPISGTLIREGGKP